MPSFNEILNFNWSVADLAGVFTDYKTYPNTHFIDGTPVATFLTMFPSDKYSIDLAVFLRHHEYDAVHRGADLPWWGKCYFTSQPAHRTMVISQDSLSRDAGSIALFAHLLPLVETESEYDSYAAKLENPSLFRYSSWSSMKNLLKEWRIDPEFTYVTDAAKVYRLNSWKDGDFDIQGSAKLLWEEIAFCRPDLIILLGQRPLQLIDNERKYREVVGTSFLQKNFTFVVAPFPIGQGRTQRGFKEKMIRTADTICKLQM